MLQKAVSDLWQQWPFLPCSLWPVSATHSSTGSPMTSPHLMPQTVCGLLRMVAGQSGSLPCRNPTFHLNILFHTWFKTGHTLVPLPRHLQFELNICHFHGGQSCKTYVCSFPLPLTYKAHAKSYCSKIFCQCRCGVCACIYMYLYGGVHAYLSTCMWKLKAGMRYLLDKSSPYLPRPDLSLNVELSSSAGLASQFVPGILSAPPKPPCLPISGCAGNPNSFLTLAWPVLSTESSL